MEWKELLPVIAGSLIAAVVMLIDIFKETSKSKKPASESTFQAFSGKMPQSKADFARNLIQINAPVELFLNLVRPAVRLAETNSEQVRKAGGTRLGGLPDWPEGLEWPRSKRGGPLSFLAQIDLADPVLQTTDLALPREGCLQFWLKAEMEDEDWYCVGGPSEPLLYYFPASSALLPLAAPDDLVTEQRYKELSVRLQSHCTFPVPHSEAYNAAEREANLSLELEYPEPFHSVGGWPNTIQHDDLGFELEVWVRGVSYDSLSENPELKESVRAAAREWVFLAQFASDEKLGTEFGDMGTFYFLIRRADLEARNFAKAYAMLQCN